MSADQTEIPIVRRKPRRSVADRLRDAILALGQHQAVLHRHEERSWASITFAGTRHTFTLEFSGLPAVEAGETFIAALPDHEFAIPGQLVADAVVNEVRHDMLPQPALMITCELLLLEDA